MIWLVVLNIHLYLNSIWLGAASMMDTKIDTCLKEIGLHMQNLVTVLNSESSWGAYITI